MTPRLAESEQAKSALQEHQLFKLCIGRLIHSSLSPIIPFLFPILKIPRSMRPQLFRAAGRAVRVPKVNYLRSFATTTPRLAEVELTIGITSLIF